MDDNFRSRARYGYTNGAGVPPPRPARPAPPTDLRPMGQPQPATAAEHLKPAAHQAKTAKTIKLRHLAIGVVVLGLVTGGAAAVLHFKKQDPKAVLSASTQKNKISSFYPTNLPDGYVYDKNFKTLKSNVYFYSVTGPTAKKFYVTIQSLPADFDFNAFNAKFLKPDQYTIGIGSVVAGPVGSSLLASIRTNNNEWVIINSTDTSLLSQIETISRSLTLSK